MKINKYTITIIIVIVLSILAIFWKRSDEAKTTDQHLIERHDHEELESEDKIVHLNEAQIENSELSFGWFEKKNLNEVVHANGYTKLPPQNEADVSVFASGIIKSIKVIEGQAVKKGEILAVMNSQEAVLLQENFLKSQSKLEFLKLEYERQKKLSEADINAKKTVEKVKSELKIEEAIFNSLKSQMNLLKLDGNGKTIQNVPIYAPISGNITDVNVKIGSSVEKNSILFSIVDNNEMHVDLLIYEKDLNQVKVGQSVRFVFTNQSNKEIKGTIFNIGKSFENETKTVAVHADIDAKTDNLIPGMYVNALIDAGTNTVSTLHEAAIVNAEGRYFIFIKEAHNHDSHKGHSHSHSEEEFKRIEVKIGASQLGYSEVTPLKRIPKESKIVTKGAYYLQSHLQKSESGGGHSH